MHQESFDPTFDTASDAGGRDPDKHSARLHSAHLLLWSKALPSGQPFELTDARPAGYLRHGSVLGTFHLGSDSIIHTYRRPGLRLILDALEPGELDRFVRVAYMIGSYHVFPLGNGRSLNQTRGFDKKANVADVLSRYREFFRLFRDFRGYVDFFLLQDLVDEDMRSVRFFLEGGFERKPLPQDVEDYRAYSQRAIAFVLARNARMLESVGCPVNREWPRLPASGIGNSNTRISEVCQPGIPPTTAIGPARPPARPPTSPPIAPLPRIMEDWHAQPQ